MAGLPFSFSANWRLGYFPSLRQHYERAFFLPFSLLGTLIDIIDAIYMFCESQNNRFIWAILDFEFPISLQMLTELFCLNDCI